MWRLKNRGEEVDSGWSYGDLYLLIRPWTRMTDAGWRSPSVSTRTLALFRIFYSITNINPLDELRKIHLVEHLYVFTFYSKPLHFSWFSALPSLDLVQRKWCRRGMRMFMKLTVRTLILVLGWRVDNRRNLRMRRKSIANGGSLLLFNGVREIYHFLAGSVLIGGN